MFLILPHLLFLLDHVTSHGGMLPINPLLGVPGYPDCTRSTPVKPVDLVTDEVLEARNQELKCFQQPKDFEAQISIGCVGDSITAGVHSSGGNHTYPGQLQIMLGDGYKVTNLGACGSTMLKKGDSPYWQRSQFKTLNSSKWDIIIIMLGTNDAKDPGCRGPNNWQHDCVQNGKVNLNCSFAQDYMSMINLVKTLGTTPKGPIIYAAIPPPLCQSCAYGMNQTVINDVFPILVPAISHANGLPHPAIDIFDALGGGRKADLPKDGCKIDTTSDPYCKDFCDKQSCDQCHPNDEGYNALAAAMKKGLGL